MTYSEWNFDIVTGITAATLGFYIWRNRKPASGLLLAWNTAGFALLVTIVVIAALSTPSFEIFAATPRNLAPSTFPFVWLPYFLVQFALLGHLATFRRLLAAIVLTWHQSPGLEGAEATTGATTTKRSRR